MFEPGMKVVCVDDKFPLFVVELYPQLPVEGSVYTVRDVVPGSQYGKGETAAVYLKEITGHINRHGIENGFACHRFRELEEGGQELSREEESSLVLTS